ncbi:MAG: hypothetical protein IKW39_00780 [Alphaproteobacteria bacterium]|nr:hypothetical protein [Alphaproteobacteria bacterium]
MKKAKLLTIICMLISMTIGSAKASQQLTKDNYRTITPDFEFEDMNIMYSTSSYYKKNLFR